MNLDRYEKMDVNMLLSIVNMKLRDEFESLESMCSYFDISEEILINRLLEIDYKYNKLQNQFK